MTTLWIRRHALRLGLATAAFAWFGALQAGDLNPAALTFKLPDQIKWSTGTASQQAVMYGDPNKPGLYVVLMKWLPGHTSRPHFHPNDRLIYVISGTWYVGTGPKYEPDKMVPMPAGTMVTHYGKGIHYDGAKDVEAILEIVGEGPATSTGAEEK